MELLKRQLKWSGQDSLLVSRDQPGFHWKAGGWCGPSFPPPRPWLGKAPWECQNPEAWVLGLGQGQLLCSWTTKTHRERPASLSASKATGHPASSCCSPQLACWEGLAWFDSRMTWRTRGPPSQMCLPGGAEICLSNLIGEARTGLRHCLDSRWV